MWVKSILLFLSLFPLPFLRRVGGFFGRLAYRYDSRYRSRLQANANQAGYFEPQFMEEAAAQMGRGILELAHLWTWRIDKILANVKVSGGEALLAAQQSGQGVLIITPHLGAFELLSLWFGRNAPFTAMYKPPKQSYIANAMLQGRQKHHVKMASADLAGIRMMLRNLKKGETVGLLPDQVPGSKGEAVVADVFGAPALTMVLPAKLLKQTSARFFVTYAIRVNQPHMFEVVCAAVDFVPTGNLAADATHINQLMEQVIRAAPTQYLWGYNRYKNVDNSLTQNEVNA